MSVASLLEYLSELSASSASELIELAFIALISYLILLSIYRLYFHPLSNFPGPWYHAISPLPLLYLNNVRGTFFHRVLDLHERYGTIVRTAPNKLSVDGGVGWTDVYGYKLKGEPEFPRDPKFFPVLEKNNSLISADVHNHRRMRRLVSHAFSEQALTAQEPILAKYVDLLVKQLENRVGQKVDMRAWFNFVTFDLIGDLAFGDSFGCLEKGSMHPWAAMVTDNIKTIARIRIFTEYPVLKLVAGMIVSKESQRKRDEHHALTRKKAKKRMKAGAEVRDDFMSYILQHNDEKGMSEAEIIRNSGTLIVAGSETTATNLSGLLYFLGTNPKCYDRLVKEIRGAFRKKADITLLRAKKLEYVHACLEETLRIYPPIGETPGRMTPENGGIIDGRHIPGGTELTIFQSTHKLSRYFEHPDSFMPERWLSGSPFHDNLSASQPFSNGPRNCLGKNLAYAEMHLIAARLLWKFDLKLAEESRGWAENQKVWINFWKGPLWIEIAHRALE